MAFIRNKYIKVNKGAKRQWFMPVILATQEAEIRRIMVGGQPRQIVLQTLSQKKPITKNDLKV
jgi:hypothetical protein